MLVRQFSLRWLLLLVTACAGISLVFSFAFRGRAWAIGLSIFFVLLGATLLVQAGMFWLVWLFSLAADYRRGAARSALRSMPPRRVTPRPLAR